MARGFMAVKGMDLAVCPGFDNAIINGEEKTSIKLVLKLI
jgi:stage V sporulation protein SpoVS